MLLTEYVNMTLIDPKLQSSILSEQNSCALYELPTGDVYFRGKLYLPSGPSRLQTTHPDDMTSPADDTATYMEQNETR